MRYYFGLLGLCLMIADMRSVGLVAVGRENSALAVGCCERLVY